MGTEKPHEGEKPTGEKPTGEKPTGEKPTGEKPTGEKPTGEKPTGEKPTNEKPTHEEKERPSLVEILDKISGLEERLMAKVEAMGSAVEGECPSGEKSPVGSETPTPAGETEEESESSGGSASIGETEEEEEDSGEEVVDTTRPIRKVDTSVLLKSVNKKWPIFQKKLKAKEQEALMTGFKKCALILIQNCFKKDSAYMSKVFALKVTKSTTLDVSAFDEVFNSFNSELTKEEIKTGFKGIAGTACKDKINYAALAANNAVQKLNTSKNKDLKITRFQCQTFVQTLIPDNLVAAISEE